jgi:hypothetical protein
LAKTAANFEAEGEGNWPNVEEARYVYKSTPAGSELRKLVADTLAYRNPFQVHGDESEEYGAWEGLLREVPHGTDLSVDMNLAAGKKWNGTKPWDDEHRSRFTVEEVSIDERWEKLILSKRSKEATEMAAEAGCLLSKLELAHLNREKE